MVVESVGLQITDTLDLIPGTNARADLNHAKTTLLLKSINSAPEQINNTQTTTLYLVDKDGVKITL